MIRSMTGYGQASTELPGFRLSVELRAVNHRYADVRVHFPEYLGSQEAELRRRVLERVRRGRVDLRVDVEPHGGADGRPQLNALLVQEVLDAARVLREQYQVPGEIDVATLLAIPGMFRGEAEASAWGELEQKELDRLLETALAALDGERVREGRHLQQELIQRLTEMSGILASVRERALLVPSTLQERLVERLRTLARGIELDPARIAQEAALAADRSDVTEEVVRLESHLAQARNILTTPDGEPLGKRLDFLLQEIHRETNTINSKSQDGEISRHALALKLEAEKVREQVQNLE